MTDHDAPDGWKWVALSEVTENVSSVNPALRPDEEFGYVDIGSISGRSFTIVAPKRMLGRDAPSRARRPIREGDVLFSNVRTYLRNIALVTADVDATVASTGITVLRPNCHLDSRFLFHYVTSDAFINAVTPRQTGSNYPATSDRVVRSMKIPLPPLEEQPRIAAKLDDLLGRVAATRERLDRVPAILRRFRQSVLAAAVSGRLTEDWREHHADASGEALLAGVVASHEQDPGKGNAAEPTEGVHDLTSDDMPSTWAISELKWLCQPGSPITYGILKPGPNIADGVPYVRVADFPGDVLGLNGIKRTSQQIDQDYRRSRLRVGDLLLSIRGTVGRLCNIPEELDNANITQDTARISVNPKMNADFVAICLRAEPTQRRMRAAMKGVAVRGINIGDVRALQIPVPPSEEQAAIVVRVEDLLRLLEPAAVRVASARRRSDTIAQSILARAFRGEL